MTTKPFTNEFLKPKYWGILLFVIFFYPLIYLPLPLQFALGSGLGKLFYLLGKSRRRVTCINLRLAFPDKTDAEREEMAKEVFINQGIGIFETMGAWLRPHLYTSNVSIEGLEHIRHAQQHNKAILLLGGHYTTLDLGGRLFTKYDEIKNNLDCVYRPQNNNLLELIVFNGRSGFFNNQISSRDMKSLIRSISAGKIVWYAPDQDYGLKQGVMAPFFGVPAATITSPRKLVRINKKNPPAVLAFHTFRTSGTRLRLFQKPSYHITVTQPLENFPSNDEIADATNVNNQLAELIRKAPTQWMWFHKRFKNDENGKTSYYHK